MNLRLFNVIISDAGAKLFFAPLRSAPEGNFFSLRSAPVSLQFPSGSDEKMPLYLVLSPQKIARYLVLKGSKKFGPLKTSFLDSS